MRAPVLNLLTSFPGDSVSLGVERGPRDPTGQGSGSWRLFPLDLAPGPSPFSGSASQPFTVMDQSPEYT